MKTLLYTTTAFVLCGGIVQANAACIATPSCTAMGYSSTNSCEGGLKCPFGSYWYCPEEIIKGGECAEFPYTCFGRGYVEAAGIGADCNGKYVKCECYEGFEWQDGKGCVDISTECKIGAIVYEDRTCSSSSYDDDFGLKTAIGIVVYIDDNGKRWAMTPKSIGEYNFGPETVDIQALPNYPSSTDAAKDYDSCGNTAKIIAAGDKTTYPAAWAAHEYKTAGTEAGDWCLPAAGIIVSIYNNRKVIDNGFIKINGGKKLAAEDSYGWIRSSTEIDKREAYIFDDDLPQGLYSYYKEHKIPVRPVIEF